MSNKITKKHIVIKTIFQIFLYLFEIMLVTSLCVWISSVISPIHKDEMFMGVFERFALFYGFYQLIVFAVFNNINDIEADEYLSLYTACEHSLLACKNNDENSKKLLIDTIEKKQLSSSTFNDVSVRECYVGLINWIKECNVSAIESLKITSNHNYEMSKLQWKFSILLRLLK